MRAAPILAPFLPDSAVIIPSNCCLHLPVSHTRAHTHTHLLSAHSAHSLHRERRPRGAKHTSQDATLHSVLSTSKVCTVNFLSLVFLHLSTCLFLLPPRCQVLCVYYVKISSTAVFQDLCITYFSYQLYQNTFKVRKNTDNHSEYAEVLVLITVQVTYVRE